MSDSFVWRNEYAHSLVHPNQRSGIWCNDLGFTVYMWSIQQFLCCIKFFPLPFCIDTVFIVSNQSCIILSCIYSININMRNIFLISIYKDWASFLKSFLNKRILTQLWNDANICITVTSYKHHGISNHQQLNCLFNRSLQLKQRTYLSHTGS